MNNDNNDAITDLRRVRFGVPVTVSGRILTRYATIDDDNKIPFWQKVGERVHKYNRAFILLENPLGCYELSRYDGATFEEKYENMMATAMSVFEPPAAARLRFEDEVSG